MSGQSKISVSHRIIYDEAHLRSIWLQLSNNCNTNAFLSWQWIHSFIKLQNGEKTLLVAEVSGELVGAGLISLQSKSVFKLAKVNQCFLNRYGTNELDQIWVENNDFLISATNKQQIREAFLQYILSLDYIDEFIFGLSDISIIKALSLPCRRSHIEVTSRGYKADLRNLSSLNDYLQSISKNTRSQINRTLKILSAESNLLFEEATTPELKHSYFSSAAEIHLDRWGQSEYGSGFSNHHFTSFHQRLLMDTSDNNITKMFKLSLGDECLGYIYVLIEENKWLFYLSAINFHSDNKIKIGLVFHALVIEQAILNNIHTYDFLAGDAQYKQSLSNVPPYCQQLVHFYRPSFMSKTRDFARFLKSSYVKFSEKLSLSAHIKSGS
jgi:CelD/BcsL family acetyltransferase involved in cellulose biosynthesis